MLFKVLDRLHQAISAERPSLLYKKTSENERIVSECPVLEDLYKPTWYLFNGHLQTIHVGRATHRGTSVSYKRVLVRMANGGTVSLDWALPSMNDTTSPYEHNHPTVLLLHGLTGDSRNNYIRSAVRLLMADGWQVVVLNARACGNTPVTSPQFLTASFTHDLREIVKLLREKHVPTAPLLAVGFSLGSNVLVKYIGEEGDSCPLTAAVSIGNVFDLINNTKHMNSSLFYYYVYNLTISKTMLRLFFQRSNAYEQFKSHPDIDLNHLEAAKTAWEFDDRLTRKAMGYASVEEYYQDASSCSYVPHVRIPLLCLSALDDPVCTHTSIPRDACKSNEHVILATTKQGGHLGFYSGNSIFEEPKMWSSQVVKEFCHAVDPKMHWRKRRAHVGKRISASHCSTKENECHKYKEKVLEMLICILLAYTANVYFLNLTPLGPSDTRNS